MKALCLNLLFVFMVFTIGCDSQSPNAKYVDGITVSLITDGALDAWYVKADAAGTEIYSAAFGYRIQITANGGPVNGIKVGCRVIDYFDPQVGNCGEYCIWDKFCPNGERYAFVRTKPGPQNWDFDEGIATTRTLKETYGPGECFFYIGLGYPLTSQTYGTSNEGYDWPYGCETPTMVSTLVEVKFIVPKWDGNIEKKCYVYFIRAQCQNFWTPLGGVIGNSYSSLEEWEGGLYSMSDESITLRVAQSQPKDKRYKEIVQTGKATGLKEWPKPEIIIPTGKSTGLINPPKPTKIIPTITFPPKRVIPLPPIKPIASLPLRLSSTGEPNESWEYIDGLWLQLKYCGDGVWEWVEPDVLNVLWMADPTDYNDGVELVSYADPYIFCCIVALEDVDINDVNDVNVNSLQHLALLKSKDENGNDRGWLPINMQVYHIEEYEGRLYIWLHSNLIITLEHTQGQGYYVDFWGDPVAAIYIPNNGHLEIQPDDLYGDFDFDGDVDLTDYNLLMWFMDTGLTDPFYNLIFDGNYDGQTDYCDLALFCQNWLKTRPPIFGIIPKPH